MSTSVASERASEPRERNAPTERRVRERVGESEGRSPSVRLVVPERTDWIDPSCAKRRNQRCTCARKHDAEQACRVGDRIEETHS